MTTLSQIIPYSSDVNMSEHFTSDFKEMISDLRTSSDGHLLDIFPPEIHNPYPIGITLNSFYVMKKVMSVVHRGLQAIVRAYSHDPRLHSLMLALPDSVMEVLQDVQSLPYNIGSWRPDILFPEKIVDMFLICEINARFPFNGYYVSHAKNTSLSRMSYLKNVPIMPIHELEGVPGAFAGVYRRDKPVYILKPSGHAGWDVNLFHEDYSNASNSDEGTAGTGDGNIARGSAHVDKKQLREEGSKNHKEIQDSGDLDDRPRERNDDSDDGYDNDNGSSLPSPPSLEKHFSSTFQCEHSGTRFVDPSGLVLGDDGNIYDTATTTAGEAEAEGQPEPLCQFAFEMSQDEIFALPKGLLRAIVTSCVYINDVRTVLLAHDKRILAVLTTPEIMQDYVSAEDVAILQRYVIPTYIRSVGDDGDSTHCNSLHDPLEQMIRRRHVNAVREARYHRHDWMLKPNGGGKGVGIVFGRDCTSDDEWERLLDDPARGAHVLQRVVQQQVFSLYNGGHGDVSTPPPDEQRHHDSVSTDITGSCGGGDSRVPGFRDMLMVGILHCFNEHFLGPGIFRASSLSHPIVNVSSGHGLILSPVILSCKWPLSRCTLPLPSRGGQHCWAAEGVGGDYDDDSNGALQHDRQSPPLMFHPPAHCVFHLTNRTALDQSIFESIHKCVISEGIALVHTHWQDALFDCRTVHAAENEKSLNAELISFVHRLGGFVNLHSHSDTTGVWDVRPVCCASQGMSGDYGSSHRPARSLTAESFDMHTDCSFEDPPPRYMCLYVLQEDRQGGGHSNLVDTEVLVRYLSRQTLRVLTTTEYDLLVPKEFEKCQSSGGGESILRGKLLYGRGLWRYRADIIVKKNCTSEQLRALDELDGLLKNPHLVLSTDLPRDSILLLDNARWMHGRSAVYDTSRWLKRVRFHPVDAPPILKPLVSRSTSLQSESDV